MHSMRGRFPHCPLPALRRHVRHRLATKHGVSMELVGIYRLCYLIIELPSCQMARCVLDWRPLYFRGELSGHIVRLERKMGLEPTTATLEGSCSTFELLSHGASNGSRIRTKGLGSPYAAITSSMHLVRNTGGSSRNRTGDILLAKQTLCHLSYAPEQAFPFCLENSPPAVQCWTQDSGKTAGGAKRKKNRV